MCRTAISSVILFALTISVARVESRELSINTIRDAVTTLKACWVPPPLRIARPGMQITVRVSFTRTGEILGKPIITFESKDTPDDIRIAYRTAVMLMLIRCTPLPITETLGNAIAGRPISIRLIDVRKLRSADAKGLVRRTSINARRAVDRRAQLRNSGP